MQVTQSTEEKLRQLEELFVKYGAVPAELNPEYRDEVDQRTIFTRNGSFFRAGTAEFDGKEFLLLSNIDDPKFAVLGIMEDVDVLPLDLEPERVEKAVRYAFGIEPYPEKYPDY